MKRYVNKIKTNSKDRIFNLLIIIVTCIFCVFMQYILFFFDKSVYLGSFLMIIVCVFFVYMGFLDKEILILNGLFLIICPILLMFGKFDFSNYIALNLISLSFLTVAVYMFKEKLILICCKFRNSSLRRIFKYIVFSLCGIFIVLCIFINKEETEQVLLRFFHPEEYFKEMDKIELNGVEYENKVKISIDNPKNGEEISGLFVVEGWAADLSDLEDVNIDKIYVILNNKPQDGGVFLGRIDTKIRREDIADKYGEKYKDAGFYIEINSRKFKNGLNKIYVYVHSNYFGWKYEEVEIYVNN